jgi:hypothetical protein
MDTNGRFPVSIVTRGSWMDQFQDGMKHSSHQVPKSWMANPTLHWSNDMGWTRLRIKIWAKNHGKITEQTLLTHRSLQEERLEVEQVNKFCSPNHETLSSLSLPLDKWSSGTPEPQPSLPTVSFLWEPGQTSTVGNPTWNPSCVIDDWWWMADPLLYSKKVQQPSRMWTHVKNIVWVGLHFHLTKRHLTKRRLHIQTL